ncbi:unnamed protein product [Owenia fusiformis]|uniref:Uncharacterized protein n=1 Tax=Owenia fusiformis TaxID=6347 RepID=A0A8J1XJY6_OWEFU|nr:unnamed protein product [Owenia fusiformis]
MATSGDVTMVPTTSYEQDLSADTTVSSDGREKKKKFHPLRAMKRLFSRKRTKSRDDESVSVISVKAKSTSALHAHMEEDPYPGRGGNAPNLNSQLSMSADSIFPLDPKAVDDLDAAHSMEALSSRDMKSELFQKIAARHNSDDDGLPGSPSNPPLTTVDVLYGGSLQGGVEKANRENSMESIQGEESIEDFFSRSFPASSSSGAISEDPVGEMDFNAVRRTNSLSTSAARHKMSVRPRKKHQPASTRRRPDVLPDKSKSQSDLPSVGEEEVSISTVTVTQEAPVTQVAPSKTKIALKPPKLGPKRTTSPEKSVQSTTTATITATTEVVSNATPEMVSKTTPVTVSKVTPEPVPSPKASSATTATKVTSEVTSTESAGENKVTKEEVKTTKVTMEEVKTTTAEVVVVTSEDNKENESVPPAGGVKRRDKETPKEQTSPGKPRPTSMFESHKMRQASSEKTNWDDLGKPKDVKSDDEQQSSQPEFAQMLNKIKRKSSWKQDGDMKVKDIEISSAKEPSSPTKGQSLRFTSPTPGTQNTSKPATTVQVEISDNKLEPKTEIKTATVEKVAQIKEKSVDITATTETITSDSDQFKRSAPKDTVERRVQSRSKTQPVGSVSVGGEAARKSFNEARKSFHEDEVKSMVNTPLLKSDPKTKETTKIESKSKQSTSKIESKSKETIKVDIKEVTIEAKPSKPELPSKPVSLKSESVKPTKLVDATKPAETPEVKPIEVVEVPSKDVPSWVAMAKKRAKEREEKDGSTSTATTKQQKQAENKDKQIEMQSKSVTITNSKDIQSPTTTQSNKTFGGSNTDKSKSTNEVKPSEFKAPSIRNMNLEIKSSTEDNKKEVLKSPTPSTDGENCSSELARRKSKVLDMVKNFQKLEVN